MKRYYRKNPALYAKMSRLLEEMNREFGWTSRLFAAIGGPYVLRKIRQEERRLAQGWTYEPPTFYDVNDAVKPDECPSASRCRYVTPQVVPHEREDGLAEVPRAPNCRSCARSKTPEGPMTMLLTPAVQVVLGLLIVSAMMAVLWFVQRRTGNAGIVDAGWAASIGILGVFYAATSNGFLPRRVLVAVLIGFWAARLAIYLLVDRVVGRGEDGRYRTLREQWGASAGRRLFFFFQTQALAASFFALPVLVVAYHPVDRWTRWDMAGVLIWCISVGNTILADRQLARFKRRPESRGKTCREGWWRYSRHPNYFFEWLHWWSYVRVGRRVVLLVAHAPGAGRDAALPAQCNGHPADRSAGCRQPWRGLPPVPADHERLRPLVSQDRNPSQGQPRRQIAMYYLKLYLSAFVVFLAIDMVWLTVVAREFYRKQLGFLQIQFNLWAAFAFYLLFVAGLLVFVIVPAVEAGSLRKALLLGAFFGLVTYATYDLTNQATVKDWPWILTIVDMTWGAVLATSVSCLGYLVGRWLR